VEQGGVDIRLGYRNIRAECRDLQIGNMRARRDWVWIKESAITEKLFLRWVALATRRSPVR
jgi:hypothetical protein